MKRFKMKVFKCNNVSFLAYDATLGHLSNFENLTVLLHAKWLVFEPTPHLGFQTAEME